MSNMLQSKTAEEILSTVFKPKEFIIDGLLTQGLYVLVGAQKVRKSWLAGLEFAPMGHLHFRACRLGHFSRFTRIGA